MAFPQITLEIGFSAGASTSTYLHLDDVGRGIIGVAKLAPAEVWTDVTSYLSSFSVSRGSRRISSPVIRYESGTGTFTLRNEDRRFDPTYLSGPYVAAGVTQVTPMRAVRLRATYAGTTYDLWRGFADSWDINYDGPNWSECVLTCSDAFKVLAGYDRVAGASQGAGEDTGARIGRILDSIGWSATDRVLAVGDSTLQATDLSGGALDEAFLAADSEIGELYVDGGGRAVFRNRNAIFNDSRSATSNATFGDGGGAELPYYALSISYDDANLANLANVTRVGGTEQTQSNQASRDANLTRTFDRSDLLLQTDAAANDYAGFIVGLAANPELRFDQLTVRPQASEAALFPHVLGREIGDRITVKRRPPGGGTITRDVYIRGVQHTGTPDFWETAWALQSATRHDGFLIIGDASRGILDQNMLGA